jgi:hypothetical protein
VNLYGFVYNESVGKTDFLGLSVVIIAVKPDFGEEGSSLDWLLLMSGFIDLPWSTIISLVDEMYSTGKEWEDSKWRIDSAYIRHGYEKHEIGSVPDLSPDFLARCDKPNEIIEGRVAGTEKYYYKISYSARYVKRSTSTCIGAWIRHTKYLTTAITKMYQYKTEKLKCICVGGGYQWQKIKGYRLHRKPVEKHWRIRKYDWDGYTIPKLPPGEEWRPEET